ncbi:MAG: TRL-like protein family [Deltaproteobacteria bacterium]|nr:MAG: TRL-like protein family [Deltaproteobacteria bacterium]
MKKVKLIIAAIALSSFILGGCASYLPNGFVYTGVKGPIATGPTSVKYTKVGKAEAKSILGLVATGDASIETAARNGGIRNIKFVDWQVENILGIIGHYTTIVYGD